MIQTPNVEKIINNDWYWTHHSTPYLSFRRFRKKGQLGVQAICSPSTRSLTLFSWLEATSIAPPSTSPLGRNANPGIFFAGTHHPGEGRRNGVKFWKSVQ